MVSHPTLLLLGLAFLSSTLAQDCDVTVFHVTPQGECRQCPNDCPPECNPSNGAYRVFTSSDCDGQGGQGQGNQGGGQQGGGGGGGPRPAVAPAPTPESVEITPSNQTCDDDESCSPKACIHDHGSPDCEFGPFDPIDWQAELDTMSCKVCAQNKESSKCTDFKVTHSDSGIKAAYCNDEYLVVWSTGLPHYDPNTDDYLGSIPLPPGGDDGCRVRSARELLTVFKVPLVTTVQDSSNFLPNPLPGIPGMPAAGAVGFSLDGVPIYPNFNNRGQLAWTSCELDRCNAHGGRGEDYHYHGDMFGSKCLYDSHEYHDVDHPPLVGYAFDGYPIHGRHTQVGLLGESINLDSCGGHEHDGMGYHYHAHTSHNQTTDTLSGVPPTDGNFTFDAYYVAPTYCWHGDVDMIEQFWEGNRQVNYDRSKSTSQESWSDRASLRPCCESDVYFVADGLRLGVAEETLADAVAETLPPDDLDVLEDSEAPDEHSSAVAWPLARVWRTIMMGWCLQFCGF